MTLVSVPEVPRRLDDVTFFCMCHAGPLPLAWVVALGQDGLARLWNDADDPGTLLRWAWWGDRPGAFRAVRAVVDDLVPLMHPVAADAWRSVRDRYVPPDTWEEARLDQAHGVLVGSARRVGVVREAAAGTARLAVLQHLTKDPDGEDLVVALRSAVAAHAYDRTRAPRARVARTVRAAVGTPTLASLVARGPTGAR